MSWSGRGTAWALALLLVGCTGGSAPGATPTPSATASIDPFAAFPECPPPPPAAANADDVEGLHLPPKATVQSVRDNGPLTQVIGFVPLRPVAVRKFYERQTDLELLQVEDEGYESEVLVSDGEHRLFVKAQALCRNGSNMAAVIAPEAAAEAVPTPSRGGTPPTP